MQESSCLLQPIGRINPLSRATLIRLHSPPNRVSVEQQDLAVVPVLERYQCTFLLQICDKILRFAEEDMINSEMISIFFLLTDLPGSSGRVRSHGTANTLVGHAWGVSVAHG